MCAYVRTYVYEEGNGESKLHVLCSYLSTELIMFDDQLGPDDCIHFPVLNIIQDEQRGRDENFIPLLDSHESLCLSRLGINE